MQDLFNNDGHLTDYALKSIIKDNLDEISRLEIAEHLSFCDECIVRYTDLLSDDTLMIPLESAAPTVMQKIKKTAAVIFFNKYVTMTIAASIAMVLWITGAFTSYSSNENFNKFIAGIETTSDTFTEKTVDFSDGISNTITNIVEIFNKKGNINNEKK